MEEAGQAIEECGVFLILLSGASLGSGQIRTEIFIAHEASRPFMPVLSGIEYAEFKAKRPSWQKVMVGAVSIQVTADRIRESIPRIVLGLQGLGIQSAPRSGVETATVPVLAASLPTPPPATMEPPVSAEPVQGRSISSLASGGETPPRGSSPPVIPWWRRGRNVGLITAAALVLIVFAIFLQRQRGPGSEAPSTSVVSPRREPPPRSAAKAEPTPIAPRGEARLTGEYTNSWALLIGVDHTPGRAALRSVADARTMKMALIKTGFPEKNIRILADPGGADIRRVILMPFDGMGHNDRYVVYFSGHSDTRRLLDGSNEGYLLAADYNGNDLLNSAISVREIRELARRMPVKHVLFILDTCSAATGDAVSMAGGDMPSAPETLKGYLREPVIEILAAGRDDQCAYQVNNQGIFTRSVVNSIEFFLKKQSGAALTATQLWVDVNREVSNASNGQLTPPPLYRDGQGEFVLWFPAPARQR